MATLQHDVQGVPALQDYQQQTTSIERKGMRIPESRSQTACLLLCRQRSVVQFSLDATQIHCISRLQDLSVQEINETWYNKAEYTEIGEDMKSTIKLLRDGLSEDPDQVRFCYRGLEHKTPERGRQRSLNIVHSVDSVLLQQKRMQLKGSSPAEEPRDIAKIYRVISEMCQDDAHRVGLCDAKFVDRSWRVGADALPRMPRRRRSFDLPPTVIITTTTDPIITRARELEQHNKPSERARQKRSLINILVPSVESVLLQKKRMQLSAELLWRVPADESPRMPRRKWAKGACCCGDEKVAAEISILSRLMI